MIRFTALQFRAQAAVAFIALVIAAVVVAITGPHLLHIYDTVVATCAAHGDCSSADSNFLQLDHGLQIALNILIVVVPGIIGLFWGAPLVAHELEARTFRLAWTQSVTRTRWVAVKIACVGLASMAVAGLLSLMVTWWSSPLDRANLNVFGTFDQRDIVPIGYAAFAFVLAVTAGVLIRRTLPAMATTLALFVFVRIAVTDWIRPHFMTPLKQAVGLSPSTIGGFGSMNGAAPNLIAGSPNIPNAWVFSSQIVDKAGNPLTSQYLAKACPSLVAGFGGGPTPAGGNSAVSVHPVKAPPQMGEILNNCVVKLSSTFHEVASYQPGSRYWPFQWYELGLYLLASLLLAGVSIWWVRSRLS
jgi:hypothetical protein